MEITALESVRIFGVFKVPPRTHLCWEDVVENSLTWTKLRKSALLCKHKLHKLQPDKQAWLQLGGVLLQDALDMDVFPVNPLTDLQADLAMVWAMGWSGDEMARMLITYEQLKQRGMTPEIMDKLNMPLSGWKALGLTNDHVEAMTQRQVLQVFKMPKPEVKQILEDFEPF